MNQSSAKTKDGLARALNAVITDTEAIIKSMEDSSSEKSLAIRAKAEEILKTARSSSEELEGLVPVSSQFAVTVTNSNVHKYPWHTIGLAAAFGLILGWHLGRKPGR